MSIFDQPVTFEAETCCEYSRISLLPERNPAKTTLTRTSAAVQAVCLQKSARENVIYSLLYDTSIVGMGVQLINWFLYDVVNANFMATKNVTLIQANAVTAQL